jgi:hypothetical protein
MELRIHPPKTTVAAGSVKSKPESLTDPSRQVAGVPPTVENLLHSGGGQPLDPQTRSFLEPRFGHDFGRVRVYTDAKAARSAQEVHALAYTVGPNIVFGAGQYRPHAPNGQHLLAHELAHVVQQGAFAGEAEQTALPGVAARHFFSGIAPSLQRKADPEKALTLPSQTAPQAGPTRVTYTDEYERYQRTQEQIAAFQNNAPYFSINHKPSTGRGFFDAMYYPPNFIISVKVRFGFADSDVDFWPGSKPEDVKWTKAQQEKWKQRFLRDVSAKWTNEKILLFCVRPGWETVMAQVVVQFIDVSKSAPEGLELLAKDINAHYDLLITKIPPGRQLQALTITPIGTRAEGVANLDSEGLKRRKNETGDSQRSAVHESGHMLGLGDTYDEMSTVAHGKLAQKELKKTVPIKDDDRLMSRGERIEREDAVTFVEAIRKATKIEEWSLTPKAPQRVPYPPDRINDGVVPSETVV